MRRRAGAPPDTEALHPHAAQLENASPLELVRLLQEEDQRAVTAVRRVLPSVARLARAAEEALRSGGRVIYVGAGTSGRLAALDAAECPPTFGVAGERVVALIAGGPGALQRAVEGAEDDAAAGSLAVRRLKVSAGDLLVGISASGSAPFVGGALTEARKVGAVTALVACTRRPRLGALASLRVLPLTGPELVAGSTRLKAGTATKLVLNALSTVAFMRLGKVRGGRMVAVRATNAKLRQRALKTVEAMTGLSRTRAAALLDRSGGEVDRALELHERARRQAPARRIGNMPKMER